MVNNNTVAALEILETAYRAVVNSKLDPTNPAGWTQQTQDSLKAIDLLDDAIDHLLDNPGDSELTGINTAWEGYR